MRLIAEIGCNHGGSLKKAKEMVEAFAPYVWAVKGQKRGPGWMENKSKHPCAKHAFGETYGAHRKALELSVEDHGELRALCNAKGIKYGVSVWDVKSAEQMKDEVDFIKIPSPVNTDSEVIDFVTGLSVPVFLSTGGLAEQVREGLEIHAFRCRWKVLACVSEYPTKYESINMNGWSWNWYDGWSSHEDGYLADIAALISMSQNGKSTYIEKHVTLDRASKGTDHSFAFTPPMMHDLKDKLEKIEEMYGIRPSSSERGEQGDSEEKC